MSLLLLYWAIMIVFYLIASKLRAYKDKFGFMSGALNVVIYVLVLIMGLRMGANEEVISSLGTIGVQAVFITAFTVAGSMLAVTVMRKILGLNRQGVPAGTDAVLNTSDESEHDGDAEASDSSGAAKTTILILSFVALGMLLGYFVIPRIFTETEVFQEMSGTWLVIGICILLGFVGFTMGLEGTVVKSLKTAGINVFLIPMAAIAGSLFFGMLYGLISPLSVREAAAVSAGFGWYTFAPGVIAEAGHDVAGAVSFMHNVIRETLGIIIIPVAAQKIGYLEAISIPGVASTDICMPIVKRSCRSETIIYSFCMGMIMSTAVPLLVPLLIG